MAMIAQTELALQFSGFKNVDLGNVCVSRSDGAYSLFLSDSDSALVVST